jgi:hypothetical protein
MESQGISVSVSNGFFVAFFLLSINDRFVDIENITDSYLDLTAVGGARAYGMQLWVLLRVLLRAYVTVVLLFVITGLVLAILQKLFAVANGNFFAHEGGMPLVVLKHFLLDFVVSNYKLLLIVGAGQLLLVLATFSYMRPHENKKKKQTLSQFKLFLGLVVLQACMTMVLYES